MSGKKSITDKLGRIRPPHVHITYDVEKDGAPEKREIPFVAGVLADLSGQPDTPLPRLKDRKFIEFDRDNCDQVMAKLQPRLAFNVENKLTSTGRLGVEVRFRKMADFEPQNVVHQVEPLKRLLELRTKLANLRSSLYGNEKLDELLREAISTTEALRHESGGALKEGESGGERG